MFKEIDLHYPTMLDNTIESSFDHAIHSGDEEFYSDLKKHLKNPPELADIPLSRIKRVESDSKKGVLTVYFKEGMEQ